MNLWVTIAWVVGLLLVAAFVGYKFGKRFGVPDSNSSMIPTSILGLLALILGFTFSMSVNRFENRQKLVLAEANAIGTTYLRADFLRDPHSKNIKKYLKEYVDVRLRILQKFPDEAEKNAVAQETERIQGLIWGETVAASRLETNVLTGSFVTSLNETIDLSASWDFILRNTVPGLIYFMIICVAITGTFFLGYMNGANGGGSHVGILALAVLFALVIALIEDLDRPRRGVVHVNQSSLLQLKQQISK
ncbi:bestrophin-like domain [Bdellovibrio sp. GT3]|uniref:bestrophin-like domain n=1 Tax=Bdellovibrio sp. GT3 TaxID=3136282 RepID=UPI0030F328F3